MLNKKDIEVLRGMFQEQEVKFDKKIDQRFAQQEVKIDQRFAQQEVRIDQKLEDQQVNLEDKMRSCILASETRMMREMKRLTQELKEEILDGVSDIIGNEILPQIDEHTREIGMIKRHLQLA